MLSLSRRVPMKRPRPLSGNRLARPFIASVSSRLDVNNKQQPCLLSGTSMPAALATLLEHHHQRPPHFSSLCGSTSLVHSNPTRNHHQRLSSLSLSSSSTIITRNGSFSSKQANRGTETATVTEPLEDVARREQEQLMLQWLRNNNRNDNDNPVGSWTSATWYQGLETLLLWTHNSMDANSNDSNTIGRRHRQEQQGRVPSPQGVQQACQLFEGLVQEWKYHQSDHQPQSPEAPCTLSWGEKHPTRTLNDLVQCWYDCYKQIHAHDRSHMTGRAGTNSRNSMATPAQMCAWIERVTAANVGTDTPHSATTTSATATAPAASSCLPASVAKEDSANINANVQIWSLILEAALLRRDETCTATFCESLLHRMVQASSSSSSPPGAIQSSTIPTAEISSLQQSSPTLSAPSTTTQLQDDTFNATSSQGNSQTPYPADAPAPDPDHHYMLFPQSFNKIMTAYVQQEKDVTAAERCLRRLQDLYLDSIGSTGGISQTGPSPTFTFRPQPESYSIVIAGWSKQGAARQAERVLQSMMDLATNANASSSGSLQGNSLYRELMPTKTHFESCLNAWRNSAAGQRVAGQRAELLLLKMDELHKEMDLDTQPCIKSIGKVLQCWVDSKHTDAAARSEAILQLMREHYFDSSSDAKTLAEGYANVLRAWSLSGAPEAPENTERLFRELLDQVGERNISAKVLQKCYNAMVTAWTRSGRQGAAAAAQAIFDDMDRKCRNGECDFLPGNAMYNAILHGWARAGNGLRAEEVLAQMDRDYRAGNQDARPDTRSFNSVILAWSKSKDANAVERAEHVFLIMRELTSTKYGGGGELQPDVVTFNAMLSSLNADGSHGITLARARRGEQYLNQLKKLYAAGDSSCRPNAVTYTKAIMLWSNVKSPESAGRAQAMFHEMHNVIVLNNQTARSVGLAYEAFIKVLEKSELPDKHERVQQVRDELKRLASRQKNPQRK
jgi:pentatricopeptide repeat protein